METTVNELKELRDKLTGKTIAQISFHEIIFTDGSILAFDAENGQFEAIKHYTLYSKSKQ